MSESRWWCSELCMCVTYDRPQACVITIVRGQGSLRMVVLSCEEIMKKELDSVELCGNCLSTETMPMVERTRVYRMIQLHHIFETGLCFKDLPL